MNWLIIPCAVISGSFWQLAKVMVGKKESDLLSRTVCVRLYMLISGMSGLFACYLTYSVVSQSSKFNGIGVVVLGMVGAGLVLVLLFLIIQALFFDRTRIAAMFKLSDSQNY